MVGSFVVVLCVVVPVLFSLLLFVVVSFPYSVGSSKFWLNAALRLEAAGSIVHTNIAT